MSEADVHFEFYRHLQNAIDDQSHRGAITFDTVRPEYGDDMDGFADIVLFDEVGDPVVVVEAKSPDNDRSRRETDPYSPKVISQAFRYAGNIGAPYFCTFNGDRLVVFDAYEEGVPLLQRSTKTYQISDLEKFGDTFLDEIGRIGAGDPEWDSKDDAFIKRVRSLHEQITPRIEDALTDHLEESEEFRDAFYEWTASQNIEYEDAEDDDRAEVRKEAAEEAAYLLINKVLFYKLLEGTPNYGDQMLPLEVRSFSLREDLDKCFGHLMEEVDFEAIYEHDEIFSEIPLDEVVAEKVQDFINELDEQNLQQFDSDVIGRIYEGVIPPERRHEMGEYYTPPAICDLITRLTIDGANDTVFDPACGSGGFLVSAYHRKRQMLSRPEGSHERVLSQIYGVDINRFPAHLSAINLAIQDLSSYTEQVNIEITDFFELRPNNQRFARERADASGSKEESGVVEELVGNFDAVVGNPPYIRGRNIDADQKEQARNHLSRVDAGDMSKRMDIYGYFLTHSTEFLADGGRMGFIISDHWLDTGYGAELQQFILDHYCIEAIIKLDRQAFDDALVGSSILILSKEEDRQAREENVAKFVRVKDTIDVDTIEAVVEDEFEDGQQLEADQMMVDENFHVVAQQQATLREEDKWSVFFHAPPMYFDLRGRDDTVELSEVADVSRGITSGANAFFYKRKEEWEELGLEEYTTPLLKATGQVTRIRCTEEDAAEWGVLDLHDVVEPALEEARERYEDVNEESFVKDWLKENGHEALVEYINWGEDEDNAYHDRPTMDSRTLWFDLGELTYPQLFIPDVTWRIHRVLWSEVDAVSDRQFYHIDPEDDVDDEVLCGILNSRLTWLMCELRGRWAEGQSMSRSEIKVYETKQLPLPNPDAIPDSIQEEIRSAVRNLMECEDELESDERTIENTEEARDQLDHAVLKAMDMENRLDELKQAISALLAMRKKEGGESTEVMVSREEEGEIIELEGVSAARESTTLGDFS